MQQQHCTSLNIKCQHIDRMHHTNGPSPPSRLTDAEIKCIQQTVGTFLFYGCTVNLTMLTALSMLATAQIQGTKETQKVTRQLVLDYAATHPDATLRFHTSHME